VIIKRTNEVGFEVTSRVAYTYKVQEDTSSPQVIVDFPEAYPGDKLPAVRQASGDLIARTLSWSSLAGTGTRLVLALAYAVPNWKASGWIKGTDGLFHLTILASRKFVVQQDFAIGRGAKFGVQQRG
jgi:hypothetical protein